jgi:uncharacterized protein GlcG (DUF336 family)
MIVEAGLNPRAEGERMNKKIVALGLGCALAAGTASAQAPVNPLDVIPDRMPFDVPYGAPIRLERAQEVIAAAANEARKHDWKMNVAVADSGGNLVAFVRMDGAQLASGPIAEHKARVAVTFRRDSKSFEAGVQSGLTYQLSLDNVIASRGGIPLVEDGKMIGAIGVSGGAGAQDEVCAKAGAAVINAAKVD